MTLQTVIVFVLVAAIIGPVVLAELRRYRPAKTGRARKPSATQGGAAKPPLRLVVNKNDMDRELAALLAKNSRKPTERDD